MKRDETHDLLCLGLYHIYTHRSTGKITTVLDKCPNGINNQRILKWIGMFAPIVMVSENPLTFKLTEKEVPSFEHPKLTPYWKMEIEHSENTPSTIKTEGVKALKIFFADPSETNYDKVINLMSFYKRYSNHPKKQANIHKPAIHLQAGAPGLKG